MHRKGGECLENLLKIGLFFEFGEWLEDKIPSAHAQEAGWICGVGKDTTCKELEWNHLSTSIPSPPAHLLQLTDCVPKFICRGGKNLDKEAENKARQPEATLKCDSEASCWMLWDCMVPWAIHSAEKCNIGRYLVWRLVGSSLPSTSSTITGVWSTCCQA